MSKKHNSLDFLPQESTLQYCDLRLEICIENDIEPS